MMIFPTFIDMYNARYICNDVELHSRNFKIFLIYLSTCCILRLQWKFFQKILGCSVKVCRVSDFAQWSMFFQYWWLFHEININEESFNKIVHIFHFRWRFPAIKLKDFSINSHFFFSWSFPSDFGLKSKLFEKYWFAHLSFSSDSARSVDYFSLHKALLWWLFPFLFAKSAIVRFFLNTGFANFNFSVLFTQILLVSLNSSLCLYFHQKYWMHLFQISINWPHKNFSKNTGLFQRFIF